MKLKSWIAGVGICGWMLLSGCANWGGQSGVHNVWRSADVPAWQPGVTTAKEVMEFLGPPSQLIPLHDETVYYYMREGKSGKGLVLLVWNVANQKTRYDRAIFFFDKAGMLKSFSYSKETLPYEPEKADS